jgi:predicted permease
MVTALFGEAGLSIHITIISMHALTLLSVLTALVELDLARERRQLGHSNAHLLHTVGKTARNTIIHPVVLPVLAGLVWNALFPPLPAVVDETLLTMSQAVVPLCLVLIGMSLAYYGMRGAAKGAIAISVLKLLVLPAVVLVVGHWGMGLTGTALAVVVMAASLPVGSNALIFAQRYEAQEAEATAAIVFSTFAFVLTAPLWLAILALVLSPK